MKKGLLLILFIILSSCKSDEEKLKDKFLQNGTEFLKKSNDNEVSEITILKIDTFSKKHELAMIAAVMLQEYEKNVDILNDNKVRWERTETKLKEYAQVDSSGFWEDESQKAFHEYITLKDKMDILRVNANKFHEMALKNNSKDILSYNVLLNYKSKDNYGMVDYKEQNLIYYPDGELRDLAGYKEYLFKKYKLNNLLQYIQ